MTRAKDIANIISDANFGGTLDVGGETTLATHLNMGDGDKIKLGASADLQIYHDGTHSFISDEGTGNLILKGSNELLLATTAGQDILKGTTGGDVKIYHNNAEKLATTSGGVDISGTIEADDKITIAYEAGSSDWELESTSGDDFTISRNGSQKLLIDGGTGFVGIANSSPQSNLHLGELTVIGQDVNSGYFGTNFTGTGVNYISTKEATQIHCNSASGQIIFKVAPTGTSGSTISWTTAMTIDNSGNVLVGKTARGFNSTGVELRQGGDGQDSHFTVAGGTVCSFNRKTNDGVVINIGQDGTVEGQISVTGSTVTYGGGHLGRWSRLLDNSKDTSIVKGTVMTNLDEMVEWGDEDNEQLNKMAVSSVEGDANVSGVFVNWDNDDDYNDMMIAMTGDMVIRIAQGVTVARGDLLISAGDGTAKTQDDDIVRSKTIAKVTSTNVSHTYDDGTYLVPCVLMAC